MYCDSFFVTTFFLKKKLVYVCFVDICKTLCVFIQMYCNNFKIIKQGFFCRNFFLQKKVYSNFKVTTTSYLDTDFVALTDNSCRFLRTFVVCSCPSFPPPFLLFFLD